MIFSLVSLCPLFENKPKNTARLFEQIPFFMFLKLTMDFESGNVLVSEVIIEKTFQNS